MIVEEVLSLSDKHAREIGDFEGNEGLREYLLGDGYKYNKNGTDRIYLVYNINDAGEKFLVGFYGLKAFNFVYQEPETKRKNTFPCLEISCLAVDCNYIGNGFGSYIVKNFIIPKYLEIRKRCAAYAIAVFSLDENSTSFYNHIGFKNFGIWDDKNNNELFISDNGRNEGLEFMLMYVNEDGKPKDCNSPSDILADLYK